MPPIGIDAGRPDPYCYTQVPDNGSIIILFGPHIAISASGELGKYRRQGQAADSAACGAVLAAYNSCCQADAAECDTTAPLDMLDLEQAWLRQRVAPRCRGVAAAQEPLQELIHGVYQDIEENMLALVNHDFGPGRLILLGGIQVTPPSLLFCDLTTFPSSHCFGQSTLQSHLALHAARHRAPLSTL